MVKTRVKILQLELRMWVLDDVIGVTQTFISLHNLIVILKQFGL